MTTTIWSVGFQTRDGMQVLRVEGGKKELIEINPEKIGIVFQPARQELKKNFLDRVKEEEIILTPGGNTFELGEAFLQRTPHAYWIPTQRLNINRHKSVPEVLVETWEKAPHLFYRFQPEDVQVRRIQRTYQDFCQIERETVALSNRISQLLRRVRDDLLLLNVSEEEFVQSYVEEETGVASKILRSIGQRPKQKNLEDLLKERGLSQSEIADAMRHWKTLSKVLDQTIVNKLKEEARELYRVYTLAKWDKKAASIAEQGIKENRLKEFVATQNEKMGELAKLLDNRPFKALMDLEGVGPRVTAALVSHIRNPLMYPTVGHLLKYFNFLPYKGRRRTRVEAAQQGGAKFGAETDLWQWYTQASLFHNEEFALIYRACKLYTWLTYHRLYAVSEEIFQKWDKEEVPQEEVRDLAGKLYMGRKNWPILSLNKEAQQKLLAIWGSGSGEELASAIKRLLSSEEVERLNDALKEHGILLDLEALSQEEDHLAVKKLAVQMELVLKTNEFGKKIIDVLPYIYGSGDWKELKKVVSRAGENIQMRPVRIERLARRAVAIELVKFFYYQWLKELGEDITDRLSHDIGYKNQCKALGIFLPNSFDVSIPARYYYQKVQQKAKELNLQKLEDIPDIVRESCNDEEIKELLGWQ